MLTSEQSYLKLLFSEFRFVVADKGQVPLSNEALTKAMTLNTNIESLGFTFSAKDIVEVISTMENPEEIYEAINSYVSVVKAKPMYPDFHRRSWKWMRLSIDLTSLCTMIVHMEQC